MTGYMRKSLTGLLLVLVALALAAPDASAEKKPWEKFKFPELGEINIPEYDRVELDNGMVLFLAEDHELPLIELSATIQAGAIYEPGDKVGLASITGSVLRSGGTASWTGDQIDEMVEAMGANVETWVGGSSGGAYMSTLTEDADQALGILAEILMSPRFDPDKIDLAKTQHKAGISRRNDEPMSIAQREFSRVVFGPDHPLARIEEYDTIGAIGRDDLVEFHARYFHPDRTWLVVVGDFESNDMVARIEKAFAAWQKADQPLPADPEIPMLPRTVNVAAKEDLTQSIVLLGHKGIRQDDPNMSGIAVANRILGGGFASRLFVEVRSNRGLAYSTGSRGGTGWRFPGTFMAFAGTKSESTEEAATVILDEIRKMITEPVTEAELRVAVDGILNSDVFNYDTKREVLDRQVLFEMYGYPRDFLQTYREQVRNMTTDKILAACQAVWKPDEMSILAVGNPADFDGDLTKFGAVNTIDITIPEPKMTLEIPAVSAESLAQGQALLDKAAAAVGGKKLAGLKSFASKMGLDLKIQGMDLHFDIVKTVVYPDRLHMLQKTPFGNMAQAVTADGGWAQGPAGIQDVTGDDLADLRREIDADIISVLRDHSQLVCQALEPEEIEGRVCDRVYITGLGDDYLLVYLDAENSLPRAEQAPGKDPMSQGPVVRRTIYGEYQTLSGLKMPATFVILHDGEEFAKATYDGFDIDPKIDDSLFVKP